MRPAALLSQQQSEGLTQQVDLYKAMKVDVFRDIDPVQGGEDMALLKRELGATKTLMGGINGDLHLANASPEEIDDDVRRTLELMAPGGGFILHVIPGVYGGVPWPQRAPAHRVLAEVRLNCALLRRRHCIPGNVFSPSCRAGCRTECPSPSSARSRRKARSSAGCGTKGWPSASKSCLLSRPAPTSRSSGASGSRRGAAGHASRRPIARALGEVTETWEVEPGYGSRHIVEFLIKRPRGLRGR